MKKKLNELANSRWFYVLLLGLLTSGVAAAGIISMRSSDLRDAGSQTLPGESLPRVAAGTQREQTTRRPTQTRAQQEETRRPSEQETKKEDTPETQLARENEPPRQTRVQAPPETEGVQRPERPEGSEQPVDAPGGSGRIFNEAAGLVWPVNGRLLREFSMDTTVYYPTLDAYKVSPALVLQAEPGSEVRAAADGIIREIGHNEEIGHYVVVDIGSDCELIYGQLVKPDYVTGVEIKQGDVIATVAEPTIYYSLEGPNLYFGMKKAGAPADPLDYMDVE